MRPTITPPAIFLLLAAAGGRSASAQGLNGQANGTPAELRLAALALAPAIGPDNGDRLRGTYRIRLVSEWPQLSDASGCLNGGQETLEGSLGRSDGNTYSGFLVRTSTISFCGSHPTSSLSCRLTVKGSGIVMATGEVDASGELPRMRLVWTPPAQGGQAEVSGDCSPGFSEAVRAMYLRVSHLVEIPLPAGTVTSRGVRLEDYGWVVSVE